MKLYAASLLPMLVATASCGGGSIPPSAEPAAVAPSTTVVSMPSDAAIMDKVYDTNYTVPDGFFVDERAATTRSYTVHHVLDESASYELCTDNFDQAHAWEDADNATRSVRGVYVGAYENERYFEFIRELSYENDVGNIDDLTSPGFARIFKCSNTSRDGVDRSLLSGFAGQLNVRPLTAGLVRQFAEYLWQFAFFPERRKIVLSSDPVAGPAGPGHALLLAFASGQGNGNCDLIEVIDWRFDATQDTGTISSTFNRIHEFEAHLIDGIPSPCE